MEEGKYFLPDPIGETELRCFLCGKMYDYTKGESGCVQDPPPYKDPHMVCSMLPACERCYQLHRAIEKLEW
jgi:hypothetical protein